MLNYILLRKKLITQQSCLFNYWHNNYNWKILFNAVLKILTKIIILFGFLVLTKTKNYQFYLFKSKRTSLLLLFLLFPMLSYGQNALLGENSCTDALMKERWAEVTPFLLTENHSESIPIFKEMLQCESQSDEANTNVALEHFTGAKVYLIRSYLMMSDLDSMKLYLDQLNQDLISFDPKNEDLRMHYKFMNFLYGEYYSEKGFNELAAANYENTIDKIFDDINYQGNGFLDKEAIANVYWFPILDLFNNAALNHTKIGDFEKANLYYKIALEFSNEKNVWQLATVHQNLAWTYIYINEYTLADKHFNSAEKLLNKNKNKTSKKTLGLTYKNKAELYYQTGKVDSAFLFLNKAVSLDIDEKTRAFTNQLYAKILIEEKRFDEAREKIRTAKEYTSFSQGKRHPEMAENYQLEADLLHAEKKYDKANQQYDKALGILTQQQTCNCKNLVVNDIVEKKMSMNIIRNKARSLFLIEGNTEWKDCYSKLNELTQELNNKYILSESSKYNLAEEAKGFYEDAIAAFVAEGEKEEAYKYSRLAKGMVLMQQVQDKKAIEAGFIPKETVAHGKKLKFKINEFQKIKQTAFINKNSEWVSETEKKLLAVENEYENWVKDVEQKYAVYYDLKYDSSIADLEAIKSEVNQREASVLEYFSGENQLYLFIVDGNNVHVEILDLYDGFKLDIKKLHQIISRNLYDKESFRIFMEASSRLHETLLGKAKNKNILKQNLIIIPDEEINLVSFEALITNKIEGDINKVEYNKLDYLLWDYNISYQYSSNLIPSENNNEIENNFLGVAPTFNNENITALPNNKEEIETIMKEMGGQIISGKGATYDNFKTNLKTSNIIHFATHAVFNDAIPLDSRIELADTSLYIYELFSLEHDMDLVVLSACETASGKRLKGEGVISLSRALIQSGCSSVISSLWEVSDQKAGELMKNFYTHFSKGTNSQQSLATAKREFLEGTISRNTHPFYWAGFVQIGKPVVCDNSYFSIYFIILILFILIIILMLKKYRKI